MQGLLYKNGIWVVQNYSKMIEYFELADSHSKSKPTFNLGVLYEKGEGVEQDYKEI